MKKSKKILVIIVIVILICLVICISIIYLNKDKKRLNATGNSNIVTFVDPVFEKMIKQALEKDIIYQSDLDEVTGVKIAADRFMLLSGKNMPEESIVLMGIDSYEYKDVLYKDIGTMKSLEDLKNFKNLSNLKINLQPNIDYNTIPNKEKISILSLSQCNIDDISFMDGFSNVMYLTLSNNNIVDIKIINKLSKLKILNIIENKIERIETLYTTNLKSLEKLYLTFNVISDISGLKNMENLKYLSLYGNNVKDISVLSSMKTIKELYLNNNQIEDISPLKSFESFDAINVSNNPIKNMDEIKHLLD